MQAADRIESEFEAVLTGMPGARAEGASVDHIYLPIDCTGEIEAETAVRLTRYDDFYPPADDKDAPTAVINGIAAQWESAGKELRRDTPLRVFASADGFQFGIEYTDLGGYTLTASSPCVVDDGIRT